MPSLIIEVFRYRKKFWVGGPDIDIKANFLISENPSQDNILAILGIRNHLTHYLRSCLLISSVDKLSLRRGILAATKTERLNTLSSRALVDFVQSIGNSSCQGWVLVTNTKGNNFLSELKIHGRVGRHPV